MRPRRRSPSSESSQTRRIAAAQSSAPLYDPLPPGPPCSGGLCRPIRPQPVTVLKSDSRTADLRSTGATAHRPTRLEEVLGSETCSRGSDGALRFLRGARSRACRGRIYSVPLLSPLPPHHDNRRPNGARRTTGDVLRPDVRWRTFVRPALRGLPSAGSTRRPKPLFGSLPQNPCVLAVPSNQIRHRSVGRMLCAGPPRGSGDPMLRSRPSETTRATIR